MQTRVESLPLPVRIANDLRAQITRGVLEPGDKIESSRAMAARLGVARGSVVAAFEQLIAEGYLVSQHGSGTRVHPRLAPVAVASAPATFPQHEEPQLLRLTPGLPDATGLITPAWRAAWREAAASAPDASQPLAGQAFLRHEVAAHLRHMRGVTVDPDHIVITAGAREGLALLLRALGPRLNVGVESPGYPSLRQIPPALGHTVHELPIDAAGVRIPGPAFSDVLDAVLVTPSHQYPYGGSMPATRRGDLVAFARDSHTLLIEDDFDSELRYSGQPLPALTSLAPEHTVLLGTFSSVISPAIACGYLVLPTHLHRRVLQARAVIGQPVAAITQTAVAHFLASGELRRHTGRMRRAYRRRRDLVLATLGDAALPIRGGLHAVVLCQRPAREVVAECAEGGIEITALADYWGGDVGRSADNGIVIGFGHLGEDELERALRVVKSCLDPAF